MHRVSLAVALALALSFGGSARAASPPAGKAGASQARTLVKHMIAALDREKHIEVKGTAHGKAAPKTTYDLRYQATGREDYQAAAARRKGMPKGTPTTKLHYILIGRATYTFAASRWYKIRSTSNPKAVDVLSLDSNGATCCTRKGIRKGETVLYKGKQKWRGADGYVIAFSGAARFGGADGRIYVDTRSYLPRGYTVTSSPGSNSGTFTLTYGGSFNITAPKT